jgi:2',3'-cyclic-nucleotide 2'-phosphodiesterase/3'-nucleotidase
MNIHKKISIIYTSDVHGQISTYDFVFQNNNKSGLSRLSTFLKQYKNDYILIDNGDILQGSPFLNYCRENQLIDPLSKSINLLSYDYFIPGNHDFNYGLDYLDKFINGIHATTLCSNILQSNKTPYYKPYEIKEINGIKIGIIGATTAYIPKWEKPEHIKDLTFISAYESVKKYCHMIKDEVDAIIVSYHGGYEKDLKTGDLLCRPSIENEGYHIFEIPEVDVLLCGHQHLPTVFKKGLKTTIQPANQASSFGLIELTFDKENKLIKNDVQLIKNDFDIDQDYENKFSKLIHATNQSLDESIGQILCDMKIHDQFLDRLNNHIFFQFINMIQRELTHADISLASLPNDALGLSKCVTKRELAANFVYVNALVKMEITGEILKTALEKNSNYLTLKDGNIVVNPSYIHPKLEHYNFDIYDGINYTYKVSNPIGKRVIELTYHKKPIKDSDTLTICLNSYRANGGGDFFMFTKGKVIEVYEISYVDIMVDYIKKHPQLMMVSKNQFKTII